MLVALTTAALQPVSSCVCPSSHPFCEPSDARCYQPYTASVSSACDGVCTASFAAAPVSVAGHRQPHRLSHTWWTASSPPGLPLQPPAAPSTNTSSPSPSPPPPVSEVLRPPPLGPSPSSNASLPSTPPPSSADPRLPPTLPLPATPPPKQPLAATPPSPLPPPPADNLPPPAPSPPPPAGNPLSPPPPSPLPPPPWINAPEQPPGVLAVTSPCKVVDRCVRSASFGQTRYGYDEGCTIRGVPATPTIVT
eukprot:5127361-Prymnesium_polylepis.1